MWHMYLPQALMLIDLIPTVVMFGGHMMVGGIWGGCADGMNVPPGLQQQGRGGLWFVKAWLVKCLKSAQH
jgi:hypothetical protein